MIVKTDNVDHELAIGDTLILTGGLADGRWKLIAYNEETMEAVFRDNNRVMIIDRNEHRIYG